MTDGPQFPPLFRGHRLEGPADPFAKAVAEAIRGCDPGLVTHNLSLDQLRAAIVFAPEVPLEKAMPVMVACGLGFQNALGALAPPEVAVHLTWEGGIRVNGAQAGRLRAAASHEDPEVEPDWLVVGLELGLVPPADVAPGSLPERTWLSEEGCTDVDPVALLEAWVRHTLWWVNRLEQDGPRRLHEDWKGLCEEIGQPVSLTAGGSRHQGLFLGVDENFGMILRAGDGGTLVVPLSRLLERGQG